MGFGSITDGLTRTKPASRKNKAAPEKKRVGADKCGK